MSVIQPFLLSFFPLRIGFGFSLNHPWSFLFFFFLAFTELRLPLTRQSLSMPIRSPKSNEAWRCSQQFIFSFHFIREYYSETFEIIIKNSIPLLSSQCWALAHITGGGSYHGLFLSAGETHCPSVKSCLLLHHPPFHVSAFQHARHGSVYVCACSRHAHARNLLMSHLGLFRARKEERALSCNRKSL